MLPDTLQSVLIESKSSPKPVDLLRGPLSLLFNGNWGQFDWGEPAGAVKNGWKYTSIPIRLQGVMFN
jgi:hypothetical protein